MIGTRVLELVVGRTIAISEVRHWLSISYRTPHCSSLTETDVATLTIPPCSDPST